jgi:hypothetical protein
MVLKKALTLILYDNQIKGKIKRRIFLMQENRKEGSIF